MIQKTNDELCQNIVVNTTNNSVDTSSVNLFAKSSKASEEVEVPITQRRGTNKILKRFLEVENRYINN